MGQDRALCGPRLRRRAGSLPRAPGELGTREIASVVRDWSSMTEGMSLEVVGLEWDEGQPGRRSGTLTARFENRPEYMAAISRLYPGTLMFDGLGQALHLALAEPLPPEPSTFPCESQLAVVEREAPPGSPKSRMRFGNNFLQAGAWVDVVDFLPPTAEGDEGLLRAWCDTAAAYAELRRFLDEPHGSALSRLDGSGAQWYVQRIDDDGDATGTFPQTVTVRLRSHKTR